MNSTNPSNIECDICEKQFVSKNHLERHKIVHTRFKLKCDICSIEVLDLEVHLKTHNQERKKHKCDICTKAFPRKADLKQHEIIHSESRTLFTCDLCGKQFLDLEAHKRNVHTSNKEKFYASSLCPILCP